MFQRNIQQSDQSQRQIEGVLEAFDKIALEHAQLERRKFTELQKQKALENRLSKLSDDAKHVTVLLETSSQQLQDEEASLDEMKRTLKSLRQALQNKREFVRLKQQADALDKARIDNAKKQIEAHLERHLQNERQIQDILKKFSDQSFKERVQKAKEASLMSWEVLFLKNRQKCNRETQQIIDLAVQCVSSRKNQQKAREESKLMIRYSAKENKEPFGAISSLIREEDPRECHPAPTSDSVCFTPPYPPAVSLRSARSEIYRSREQLGVRASTPSADLYLNRQDTAPYPVEQRRSHVTHLEPFAFQSNSFVDKTQSQNIDDRDLHTPTDTPRKAWGKSYDAAVDGSYSTLHSYDPVGDGACATSSSPIAQPTQTGNHTPVQKIRIVLKENASHEQNNQLLKNWLQRTRAQQQQLGGACGQKGSRQGVLHHENNDEPRTPVSRRMENEQRMAEEVRSREEAAAMVVDSADDCVSIADSGIDSECRSIATTPYTPRFRFQFPTPQTKRPGVQEGGGVTPKLKKDAQGNAVKSPFRPEIAEDEDSDGEMPISQHSTRSVERVKNEVSTERLVESTAVTPTSQEKGPADPRRLGFVPVTPQKNADRPGTSFDPSFSRSVEQVNKDSVQPLSVDRNSTTPITSPQDFTARTQRFTLVPQQGTTISAGMTSAITRPSTPCQVSYGESGQTTPKMKCGRDFALTPRLIVQAGRASTPLSPGVHTDLEQIQSPPPAPEVQGPNFLTSQQLATINPFDKPKTSTAASCDTQPTPEMLLSTKYQGLKAPTAPKPVSAGSQFVRPFQNNSINASAAGLDHAQPLLAASLTGSQFARTFQHLSVNASPAGLDHALPQAGSQPKYVQVCHPSPRLAANSANALELTDTNPQQSRQATPSGGATVSQLAYKFARDASVFPQSPHEQISVTTSTLHQTEITDPASDAQAHIESSLQVRGCSLDGVASPQKCLANPPISLTREVQPPNQLPPFQSSSPVQPIAAPENGGHIEQMLVNDDDARQIVPYSSTESSAERSTTELESCARGDTEMEIEPEPDLTTNQIDIRNGNVDGVAGVHDRTRNWSEFSFAGSANDRAPHSEKPSEQPQGLTSEYFGGGEQAGGFDFMFTTNEDVPAASFSPAFFRGPSTPKTENQPNQRPSPSFFEMFGDAGSAAVGADQGQNTDGFQFSFAFSGQPAASASETNPFSFFND